MKSGSQDTAATAGRADEEDVCEVVFDAMLLSELCCFSDAGALEELMQHRRECQGEITLGDECIGAGLPRRLAIFVLIMQGDDDHAHRHRACLQSAQHCKPIFITQFQIEQRQVGFALKRHLKRRRSVLRLANHFNGLRCEVTTGNSEKGNAVID